jgi:hypothetical protein
VPCFVNWGLKGTTDNGKRYCISQVLELGVKDITIMRYDGTTPACAGVIVKKRKSTPELASPPPPKKKPAADRKQPDLSYEDPYQRTYQDKAGTSSRAVAGTPRTSPSSNERKDRGKERRERAPAGEGSEVGTFASPVPKKKSHTFCMHARGKNTTQSCMSCEFIAMSACSHVTHMVTRMFRRVLRRKKSSRPLP